MTNQVNQAFEQLFGETYNDLQFNKAGMIDAWQAATKASESEIKSLKQRVEELQADNLRLREALEHMVEGNVPEYDINNYKKLLSTTNTQSLADHDNATIERIATALENAEGELKYLPEYVSLVRGMKATP